MAASCTNFVFMAASILLCSIAFVSVVCGIGTSKAQDTGFSNFLGSNGKGTKHAVLISGSERLDHYNGHQVPISGHNDNHVDDHEDRPPQATCADRTLFYLRNDLKRHPPGSEAHASAMKKLNEALDVRKREDRNLDRITNLLISNRTRPSQVTNRRSLGSCPGLLINIYQENCGLLTNYGLSHFEDFENLCDSGVTESEMIEASLHACSA